MVRGALIFLVAIHGLIHLTGFAKAYHLANVKQLTMPISRISGLIWLLASILFLASAVICFLKLDWWWMLAAIAVVVSQTLIILYWQDAKLGTVANVLILISCLLGYGSWDFTQKVEAELEQFHQGVSKRTKVITEKYLDKLPPTVKRWMYRSSVVGKKRINYVRFVQTGTMKTDPAASWMPVKAEQYVKTAEPGFLWVAEVNAAPGIYLAGRDKYAGGKGHMLIKLLSLIPVADSRGPEIDQGTLLRYLAEMVWYPTAALEDYIRWEQTSSKTARATMSYKGVSASGEFTFNEDGDAIRFEAQRYYDRRSGKATLETWVIDMDPHSFKLFDDIRVPTKAEVTWKLDEGDFSWYKLQIDNLDYYL